MGFLLLIEFAVLMYGSIVLFTKLREDLIGLGWFVGFFGFIALAWVGVLPDINRAILGG